MDPTIILTAGLAQVCSLLGLWIRLHWRSRQTQAERQYLTGLAHVVGRGHSWEVDEQGADGKRLRIRVTAKSPAARSTAA